MMGWRRGGGEDPKRKERGRQMRLWQPMHHGCRLDLGFNISISVTERASRNTISGMPFMSAAFDLFLAFGSKSGAEEQKARRQLKRG